MMNPSFRTIPRLAGHLQIGVYRWPEGSRPEKENTMLWTIFAVMIALWLLGMVTAYTMGGLIHILLIIALIVMLVRIIRGRKVL